MKYIYYISIISLLSFISFKYYESKYKQDEVDASELL